MSSYTRISLLSGRSGNSIKNWLRMLPGFQPEAIQRVSSLFADVAGGVHSGHLNVATNAVQATGTITLSSFANGDTITIANQVYGTTGIPASHLLTAATYAVLGDTAVTAASTGTGTTLTGDLGSVTASSITGFPNGTYTGTRNEGNAAASQANTDATAAYTYYTTLPGFVDISATDLGGHTLTPGNYSYSSSATWSAGALTFDAGGNPNAQFVIKTGTTLVTPSAASVILINGAKANNIYWMIGSSATLGTTTSLAGTIIAHVSITMNTNTILVGRALALTGAVTLDHSAVTVPTPPVPPPPANQFAVGASDTITAANAVATINANGTCLISASSVGPVITITSTIPGTIGNFLPIAISGDGSASGAFLSGGSEDGCIRMYNGIRTPNTSPTIP